METEDWAPLILSIVAVLAALPAIPNSSARPKWIAACVVLILVAVGIAVVSRNTDEPTATEGPDELPAATVERTTTPPVTPDPPPATEGPLLITFSVDETYSLGKDKAKACIKPEAHFCLILNRTVLDDSGEIRSGCTLSWRLYADSSSKLLEKGRITSCNSSADSIFIGDGIPVAPGAYRLEADVELDTGRTGSATYRFTVVD